MLIYHFIHERRTVHTEVTEAHRLTRCDAINISNQSINLKKTEGKKPSCSPSKAVSPIASHQYSVRLPTYYYCLCGLTISNNVKQIKLSVRPLEAFSINKTKHLIRRTESYFATLTQNQVIDRTSGEDEKRHDRINRAKRS